MDDQQNPDVAPARTLIARPANGVEQMEDAPGQTFGRLAALVEMLARLEEPAGPCDTKAVEAAGLEAATLCREAKVLLRYLDSHAWTSARVVPNGMSRA